EGGHPIGGRIRPSGNKNAALPLIAATLLTDDEVVLTNVPAIRDVDALVSILRDLGDRDVPRIGRDRLQGRPRQRRRAEPGGLQADPRLDPACRAAARAPRPRAAAAPGR